MIVALVGLPARHRASHQIQARRQSVVLECGISTSIAAMTTGIVRVALFAAKAAGVPLVVIRSTLRFTSSAASTRKRSGRPSAER